MHHVWHRCCHWFGCIWWLAADIEIDFTDIDVDNNNWLPPAWLREHEKFEAKYWHCFFWGAGMVTSMVPRDIEPITTFECVHYIVAPRRQPCSTPTAPSLNKEELIGSVRIAHSRTHRPSPRCVITTSTMFGGLLLNAFVISSFTSAFASMDSKKELAGKQVSEP